MKSLRMKLFTGISMFVIALSILIIGVWAVGETQTITMNGSVNFEIADKSLYVQDVRMQEDVNSAPYSLKDQGRFMPGFINGNFDMNLGDFTNSYGSFALYFDIINTMDETTSETFAYTVEQPTAPSGAAVDVSILGTDGTTLDQIPQGTVKPSQITDSTQITATIRLTISITSSSSVDLSEITITINQVVSEVYDYFTFVVNSDGNTVTLTKYDESLADGMTEIVIPEKVDLVDGVWQEGNKYTVTAIVPAAIARAPEPIPPVFSNSSITKVVMPNTIEEIVLGFSGENLKEVIFSTGLTSIGSMGFQTCSGLTNLDLSNCTNLTSIGDEAFAYCDGLTSVTFPSGLTSIDNSAFNGCDGLEIITVEKENTVYHSENNCLIETSTNTLILGCKNSIVPSYITSIGDYAFYSCDGLTSVDLSGCTSLTSIGDYAFSYCYRLTSVTLPTRLTSIGSMAFNDCYALAEVYNYSSLNVTAGRGGYGDVGRYANVVYKASDLTDGKPATRIQEIDNVYYYVFDSDFIALVSISEDITSVTLDNHTTEINQCIFEGCENLKNADLSNCISLTSVGDEAFARCTGLKSLDLSGCASLKSIGRNAFYDCSGLTSVDLSGCTSLTSIGRDAFQSCRGLTSVSLPSSLTDIGNAAFFFCNKLTEVIIDSEYVYTNATSASACGDLLENATTIKVLTSLVSGSHAYINSTNFPSVTTEVIDGKDYTVYSK